MKRATVTKVLALATVTGVRSMAGVTALAAARRGPVKSAMMLAVGAEMLADKTPFIGNRIDPLPLGGRALMGAVVGAWVAHEAGENAALGGVLGAATAIIATRVAYDVRRHLRIPNAAGGVLEDALVVAVAARYA